MAPFFEVLKISQNILVKFFFKNPSKISVKNTPEKLPPKICKKLSTKNVKNLEHKKPSKIIRQNFSKYSKMGRLKKLKNWGIGITSKIGIGRQYPTGRHKMAYIPSDDTNRKKTSEPRQEPHFTP